MSAKSNPFPQKFRGHLELTWASNSLVGFIIKGINIPIPLFISRPLLVVAATLRLVDPPCPRRRLKGAAETTTTPPVLEGLEEPQLPSRVATRGSLRSGVSRRKSFEVGNLGGVQRQGEEALSRSATATDTSDLGIVGEGDNEVVGDGVRPSLRSRSESKIGLSSREESIAGKSRNEADEDRNENAGERRLSFPLDLRTAPVVGVILLLITTTIDGSVLRLGIVGEDGVQPYDVLVLFISLVRSSPSSKIQSFSADAPHLQGLHFDRPRFDRGPPSPRLLDRSNRGQSTQIWFNQRSQGSKRSKTIRPTVLFLVLLWRRGRERSHHPERNGVFGLFHKGNWDFRSYGVSVLLLFMRFGLREAKLMLAMLLFRWTFSQFISANIASAVLVPSNPTNVLIAGVSHSQSRCEVNLLTYLPSRLLD